MKINFMIALTVLAIFAIFGILGTDYYIAHKAIGEGLQQCISFINENKYEVIWTKECN